MNIIIYGGVKYVKVRHAVFCKLCRETIESKSLHDCVKCSCGAACVDGGIELGNRILGDIKKMESRSIYSAKINGKTVWLSQDVIDSQFN
jgi:hypothetical protein